MKLLRARNRPLDFRCARRALHVEGVAVALVAHVLRLRVLLVHLPDAAALLAFPFTFETESNVTGLNDSPFVTLLLLPAVVDYRNVTHLVIVPQRRLCQPSCRLFRRLRVRLVGSHRSACLFP